MGEIIIIQPTKAATGLRSILFLCISIALTTIIVAGCSREKKSSNANSSTAQGSDTDNSPDKVHRDPSQRTRLDSLLGRLDDAYRLPPKELIAKLGTPLSAETLVTKNIHTEERDFIYKYRFKGLAVSTYYASGIDRHLLVSVETNSFAELSSLGLAAGMRADSLRRLFGGADSTIVDSTRLVRLQYEIGDDAVSDIFFLLREDKLQLITYRPYID